MKRETGKVCYNCCHCIRSRDEETLYTVCHCEISGNYLSNMSVLEGWCRHWAKEKEGQRMKCSECVWWDTTQSFDNKKNWCKCMNPNAPGYKMWREKNNNLCKGYGERRTEGNG